MYDRLRLTEWEPGVIPQLSMTRGAECADPSKMVLEKPETARRADGVDVPDGHQLGTCVYRSTFIPQPTGLNL